MNLNLNKADYNILHFQQLEDSSFRKNFSGSVAFTVSISMDGSPVNEESNFDETYLLKNKSIMKGLKKKPKDKKSYNWDY